MKIQAVTFPLNLGIATDLEINALDGSDTGSQINVNYHFKDLTKNTTLGNGPVLPYRILFSNNIILTGDDYLAYKEDPTMLEGFVVELLGVTPDTNN